MAQSFETSCFNGVCWLSLRFRFFALHPTTVVRITSLRHAREPIPAASDEFEALRQRTRARRVRESRAEEGQEALCELWVRHIRLTCCSRARGGRDGSARGSVRRFLADRLQTFPSSPSASPPAHRTAAFIASDRPRSERDRIVLAPMSGRPQGRRCGLTPDDGVAHAEAPSSQVATLPRTFTLRGPLPARSQLVVSSPLAPQTLPSSKYRLTEHRPARGVRPDQRGG